MVEENEVCKPLNLERFWKNNKINLQQADTGLVEKSRASTWKTINKKGKEFLESVINERLFKSFGENEEKEWSLNLIMMKRKNIFLKK